MVRYGFGLFGPYIASGLGCFLQCVCRVHEKAASVQVRGPSPNSVGVRVRGH